MEWISTENLLTIIAVLMANMNRQNRTIQKLLKPLEKFIEKVEEAVKEK